VRPPPRRSASLAHVAGAATGAGGAWLDFRIERLHERRIIMSRTAIEDPKPQHVIAWSAVITAGAAVLAIAAVVGVPLAGWHGALAALVFSSAVTTLLAAGFTHGMPRHP
jgi:hypothetical protein